MALTKAKIAIAGIGTVGKGLLRILEVLGGNASNIEVTAIASRRKVNIPNKTLFKKTQVFKDAEQLLQYDNYDILVELIGGEDGVAKKIVFNAYCVNFDRCQSGFCLPVWPHPMLGLPWPPKHEFHRSNTNVQQYLDPHSKVLRDVNQFQM